MSEQGQAGREWRFYIKDMIGFADKVLSYTEDMDQQSLPIAVSPMMRFSVIWS